jgi:hypothetical protein
MVSETDFQVVRQRATPQLCVFEKALLARCVDCPAAERHLLAEREAVNCADAGARLSCAELKQSLRIHLAFVLKLSSPDEPLPHAKSLRLQCGGLQGLAHALTGTSGVDDVRALLARAGEVDDLPYAAVVPHVAAYAVRQRS